MKKISNDKNISKIYKKILTYKKVTIFGHINIDNDCYGSSLAMAYFLRSLKIDARIIGLETTTNKDVIKQIDNSIPEPDDKFIKSSLAIVLDLGTSKNLISNKFSLCKESVRIDHHPKVENFCDIEWIDTNFCSTCEMVGWFIISNNESKMSKKIANALYVGILTDSGNLMYPSAKASAYKLVATFFDYGFDKQKKQDELYLRSKDEIIKNHKMFKYVNFVDDEIAYIVITDKLRKKYNLSPTDSKIHLMSGIKEIKVWFSIYFSDQLNKWKVSIRSRDYPVRDVAIKYGGGGHQFASGFCIESLKEINKIIDDIRKFIHN